MIQISAALAEQRLHAVANFLGAGSAHAKVHIYSGERPALGVESGERLVSLTLARPVGVVEAGRLRLTPTLDALVEVSGEARWARVVNGDGVLALDCDVSDMSGAGNLRLPSTLLYAGGVTRILSGLIG